MDAATKEFCELQCQLMKRCYEADRQKRILKDLKKKRAELQQVLEGEKNDLSNLIKNTKQLFDLRISFEIENKIDSNLNKTGEDSLQYIKDLIGYIHIERNKVEIQNMIIKSRDQLSELINDTQSQIITFQTNEQQNLREIVELAKCLPLLDEKVNKSLDATERCSEVIRLLKRLTLHSQALETVIHPVN